MYEGERANNSYNSTEVEVTTSGHHPWLRGGIRALVGVSWAEPANHSFVLLLRATPRPLGGLQSLPSIPSERASSIGAGGIFECF